MSLTEAYLSLSAIMFGIGTLGVLIRKNTIVIFMCIELMLNAVNLSFVTLSKEFGQIDGQVYVFFVMAVAAAEASVGLAIIMTVFRNFYSIDTEDVHDLQG
jgi:NADH-quinone oxidoreductase subunit K